MKRYSKISLLFFMIAFLVAVFPVIGSAASSFKDVKTTHWAHSSIEWASKEGITSGYPDGTFGPDRSITEAEFATMLTRFTCSSKGSMQAAPGKHHASAVYSYLSGKNIPLNGMSNANLRDVAITKGQVARIVAASQGVDLSEQYAAHYMFMNDLATGATGNNTYKDYGANLPVTRADAVVLLDNLFQKEGCNLIGLNKRATGSDNGKYTLPAGFLGNETVWFPEPENVVQPPNPIVPPSENESVEFDIEQDTLIANGVDSTFITLSLKSCTVNPIEYEDSYSINVTSSAKATIRGDGRNNYSSTFNTDGPDLTVEVTAPRSNRVVTDTITFQVNRNNKNLECYTKPITVQLTYVPQAELRIETEKIKPTTEWGNFEDVRVTATIVSPGGQVITDYNGRVRFRSAQGSTLSSEYVYFWRGVATTIMSSPIWNNQTTLDEIYAEIDQVDLRYKDELASILDKTHSQEVLFEQPLRMDTSCPLTGAEIAFIIDSSGSMNRNDKDRLRVTKTEEFLDALGSTNSIASRFNSTGSLLSASKPAHEVKRTIYQVGQSGGTNIAQGLDVAFRNFKGSGPKIAILLTDGNSNEKKTLEMLKKAKDQNIKIFTIGLGKDKQLNEKLLQRLADETGGQYFHVEESIDIGLAYQSILSEITCGVPAPSCSYSSQVFNSPELRYTSSDFFMSTFVTDRCGEIARVVLRFNSSDGDIDYELVFRGQDYYALTKGIHEISNFNLYKQGVFLAYDASGKLIGERYVDIKR